VHKFIIQRNIRSAHRARNGRPICAVQLLNSCGQSAKSAAEYSVVVPSRETLLQDVENNYEKWLEFAMGI
jgi:hypothetical protein